MKVGAYAVVLMAAFVVCVRIAIQSANGDQPGRSPMSKDLYGDWVGYDASCLKFYRLNIRGTGAGTCKVLFNEERSGSYNVKWRLESGKLSLGASAASPEAEAIRIEVSSVDGMCMEIIVRGVTRDWERKARLYNEKEFLKRLRLTK
jgi:hypothetical protein